MGIKRTVTELDVSSVKEQPSVAVASFFKGFKAPKDATFNLYKNKSSQDEFLLHGENERLEYQGNNKDDSIGCQYVVGVYDPSEKSIELYKAPLIPTTVVSKAKKNLAGPKIKQTTARTSAMRTALGEAFGTKKAKKAIAEQERNRIDSDKLVGSAIDIVDSVKTAAKDLPTKEELQNAKPEDRPIPPVNVDATDVEQVYPVHAIIPKSEWSFIRVGPIMKELDSQKKQQLMPYTRSKYVISKLPTLSQAAHMQKLQLLYYLSLLLGVYENRRCNDKKTLLEKLNFPPEALIDGILERFTMLKQGQYGRSKDRSFTIDPQKEDKLLCYIVAIIMHLDNFIVEVSPIAQELGLKPSKMVNIFRTLGAIVKGATVSQAQAFGIPKSTASTYKIATLKVPFKLPELSKRARGGRN